MFADVMVVLDEDCCMRDCADIALLTSGVCFQALGTDLEAHGLAAVRRRNNVTRERARVLYHT